MEVISVLKSDHGILNLVERNRLNKSLMIDTAIGVDIGGTRTKSGLVNIHTGEVLNIILHATEADSETKFLSQLDSSIQQHQHFAKNTGYHITGIGLGVPGFVNAEGVVDSTYGFLPFMEDYPLAYVIENKYKLLCKIDNDARAVALGEAIYGKGKGFNRVLVLTLGTGLGLGFVKHRRFEDALPYAHMGGHMTITHNDYACYCGKTGCLESLVSSSGIAYEGQKINWSEKYPDIPLNGLAIFEAANDGNKDAQNIVQVLLNYLRTGIQNYINLYAPDIVVIGGGIAKGIHRYAAHLKANDYLKPYKRYHVEILVSELQENAGILGCAALLQ